MLKCLDRQMIIVNFYESSTFNSRYEELIHDLKPFDNFNYFLEKFTRKIMKKRKYDRDFENSGYNYHDCSVENVCLIPLAYADEYALEPASFEEELRVVRLYINFETILDFAFLEQLFCESLCDLIVKYIDASHLMKNRIENGTCVSCSASFCPKDAKQNIHLFIYCYRCEMKICSECWKDTIVSDAVSRPLIFFNGQWLNIDYRYCPCCLSGAKSKL